MRATCLTRLVHDLVSPTDIWRRVQVMKPVQPPIQTPHLCISYTRATLMTTYTLNYVMRRWLISRTFPYLRTTCCSELSGWQPECCADNFTRSQCYQLPSICQYITDDDDSYPELHGVVHEKQMVTQWKHSSCMDTEGYYDKSNYLPGCDAVYFRLWFIYRRLQYLNQWL
jgi:hypothetical protein